ncbi:MAG: hypothetical protein AB8B61_00205 [Cyclobacteriaceae bacterium]
MKLFTFIVFFSLISVQVNGQHTLTRQKVDNIKLYVADALRPLDARQSMFQYGLNRPPKAFFIGNNERTVFTITEILDTLNSYNPNGKARQYKRSLKLEKRFFKSSIYALGRDFTFLEDTIRYIDKRPFTVLEFTGLAEKEKNKQVFTSPIYRYIQYCFIDDTKYVFNFSCPASRQKYWQSAVRQMMNSVILKK